MFIQRPRPIGVQMHPIDICLNLSSICHPFIEIEIAEIHNIIRKLYYALQNDVILSLLGHDVMTWRHDVKNEGNALLPRDLQKW